MLRDFRRGLRAGLASIRGRLVRRRARRYLVHFRASKRESERNDPVWKLCSDWTYCRGGIEVERELRKMSRRR